MGDKSKEGEGETSKEDTTHGSKETKNDGVDSPEKKKAKEESEEEEEERKKKEEERKKREEEERKEREELKERKKREEEEIKKKEEIQEIIKEEERKMHKMCYMELATTLKNLELNTDDSQIRKIIEIYDPYTGKEPDFMKAQILSICDHWENKENKLKEKK